MYVWEMDKQQPASAIPACLQPSLWFLHMPCAHTDEVHAPVLTPVETSSLHLLQQLGALLQVC